MNAYRKIKFTTPTQTAAQLIGILTMFAALLASFVFLA